MKRTKRKTKKRTKSEAKADIEPHKFGKFIVPKGAHIKGLLTWSVCLLLVCISLSCTPASDAILSGGRLSQSLDAVKTELLAAKAITCSQGITAHLEDAQANLASAQAEVKPLTTAAEELPKVQEELKAEQAHWVGYKARHAILTVVLVGVAIGLGIVALYVLSALSGPVGIVSGLLLHTVTLGVGKLATALRAKLTKGKTT